MSWKDKMKAWGGGDISFLSSDGECIMFVVVAEPVLLEGKYKGNPSQRIGCPVVTDEGFVLFITGKRAARKLCKFEDKFKDSAFIMVRHGAEGDIHSTVEVKLLDDDVKAKHLFGIAKKEYKPELLKQAVKDAEEVMQS